jgi:hypothetical protein
MKPLSQLSAPRRSHRGEEAPVGLHSKHPALDYHFQAPAGDLRAANDSLRLAPSFRDLSSEFLATEMKRDYVIEAVFFAIIVGISAWPIVSMIQALGPLVK